MHEAHIVHVQEGRPADVQVTIFEPSLKVSVFAGNAVWTMLQNTSGETTRDPFTIRGFPYTCAGEV